MAFQLSPGVLVTERDLTLVVPAVATTNAGFVGDFKWGPADEIRVIDSENNFVPLLLKLLSLQVLMYEFIKLIVSIIDRFLKSSVSIRNFSVIGITLETVKFSVLFSTEGLSE